ncbi:NADP-dependent alcohol dehydrogenase C 1 [Diplonema papillatum]|nr:NADP-dependent alcohol dehydrogenase C 1 [Diplonema papillatum]|eukprot:gene15692-23954_t
MTHPTIGYAADSAEGPLKELKFERRALRPTDVGFEVLYCGVCHTDLHMKKNDWGVTKYPLVPGHEVVGRVVDAGSEAKKFKAGDLVAVGYFCDSCLSCDQCGREKEQLCRKGTTPTSGGVDRESKEQTQGGFSKYTVVKEHFLVRVPSNLDASRAAPLLCAGVTTYSPLRKYNIGPKSRVGVVGIGGLGHIAIKLAAAMGAEVTVLSRSSDKEKEARALGASKFILSKDKKEMEGAAASLDLILDTVPVKHDINPYMPLLDVEGTLCIVGHIGMLDEINTMGLVMGRKSISGSPVGSIAETQELLDFCAEKNVLPECEMIRMDYINKAFERLENSDVRYRFVIDMSSLDGK